MMVNERKLRVMFQTYTQARAKTPTRYDLDRRVPLNCDWTR